MKERGPLGSRKAQGKLSALDRMKMARQDEDLRFVMSDERGRRFIWRLLDGMAGMQRLSFTGNSETFFREGRRAVGLELLGELHRVASAEYVHMLGEQLATQQKDELLRKNAEAEAEHDDDGEQGD